MLARLAAIAFSVLLSCGGPDKPPAAEPAPEPAADPAPDPEPEPEPVDESPPLTTETDPPEQPATERRPLGDHTGSIRGTVTAAPSGKPLAGVTVFLEGPDGLLSTVTDADGNYEITGVPPGTHEVTYSYKKSEATTEVEVEAASATVVPVALPLSKTAPVIVH